MSKAMEPWMVGSLRTPWLLILLIVALVILGGLLILLTRTLVSVKRAADRQAVDHHRSGDETR